MSSGWPGSHVSSAKSADMVGGSYVAAVYGMTSSSAACSQAGWLSSSTLRRDSSRIVPSPARGAGSSRWISIPDFLWGASLVTFFARSMESPGSRPLKIIRCCQSGDMFPSETHCRCVGVASSTTPMLTGARADIVLGTPLLYIEVINDPSAVFARNTKIIPGLSKDLVVILRISAAVASKLSWTLSKRRG